MSIRQPINVLVISAGVMSGINIIKSLRLQKELEIYIVATDVDRYAPGLYLADIHYLSPPINEEDNYLEFLFNIIKKHNISVLYPCYSKEIVIISEHQAEFQEIGANVLIPPMDVVNFCNDKLRIAQFVDLLGIPVPNIIDIPLKKDLPLFSKRLSSSGSSGSIGANLVEDIYYLKHLELYDGNRMYQEYINGIEYTVDTFCDYNSNVLIAAPRKRLSTKSGQTIKGVTVNNKLINEYVAKICKKVGLIGVCNIQFIERKNKYYFIEINPRYAAGGLMLTLYAGSNLPFLALKLMLKLRIDQTELIHKPGIVMTRYWEEIILYE